MNNLRSAQWISLYVVGFVAVSCSSVKTPEPVRIDNYGFIRSEELNVVSPECWREVGRYEASATTYLRSIVDDPSLLEVHPTVYISCSCSDIAVRVSFYQGLGKPAAEVWFDNRGDVIKHLYGIAVAGRDD